MMCAGRVEVKLRQSEVEGFESKLNERETEVDSLKDKLKQQQQKLQELEEKSLKSQKFEIRSSSSKYSYAYSHLRSMNEMEKYEIEQLLCKLRAEILEYKMRLTFAESQRCGLETQMQLLIRELASVKTELQAQAEKVHFN